MYKPNVSFKDHRAVPHADRQASVSKPVHGMHQSISLLPLSYGKLLNTNVMNEDPFYALTELFTFASTSEIGFLNIMATQIDDTMADTPDPDPDTSVRVQASLVLYRRALEEHAHRILETLTFVKNRNVLKWPRSQTSKAYNAAIRTEQDFEYLLDRTRLLHQRCERELIIMMNNASIAEARRGIAQGKRVFKFTVLAFIYVPLSFSCSVFGMNFVQFSKSRRGYWAWASVTGPMIVISLVFIAWDEVRKWTRRAHKVFKPRN
jgi:Mg2+ and Co2+ transporter CorA